MARYKRDTKRPFYPGCYRPHRFNNISVQLLYRTMKEALCIIIFFLVAISLNAQSTVFRRDSFVDYGGDIAYKVEVVSLEVVKDTALINARRLEILRQIDGLVLELEYLDDLKSQWKTLDMGGKSIMQGKANSKTPAKKPVAPKKQPANSNTKPSKPKKQ